MKAVSRKKAGSPSRNGVHKPACITFAEWIKSVPPGVPREENGQVTISINLTMDAAYWTQLALGASRNGWTLEETAMRLIVEGGPGLVDWQNDGFMNRGEQEAHRKKTLDAMWQRGAKDMLAHKSAKKGGAR